MALRTYFGVTCCKARGNEYNPFSSLACQLDLQVLRTGVIAESSVLQRAKTVSGNVNKPVGLKECASRSTRVYLCSSHFPCLGALTPPQLRTFVSTPCLFLEPFSMCMPLLTAGLHGVPTTTSVLHTYMRCTSPGGLPPNHLDLCFPRKILNQLKM